MNKHSKLPIPFHPILFGLYPAITLYYLNIGEIVLPAIQQAIFTSVIILAGVSLFFLLLLRSWHRAALPISFTLIMFLTYGHLYNLPEGASINGFIIGRHRILFPIWGLLLIYGNYLLINKSSTRDWNRSLNTISGIMVALVVAQIGSHFYQASLLRQERTQAEPNTESITADATNRDVYYILLDAYSRQDLLLEEFNLDTSDFIAELESLGFYIPRCAQGNYFNTYSAMTSTLNMQYLDALGIDATTANQTIFSPFIQQNAVRRNFEELGYQTITFKGLYPTIDISDSTYYFDYFENNSPITSLDSINFQYLFLKTTAFLPFIDYLESRDDLNLPTIISTWIPIDNADNSREYRQYQQSVFALDTLESVPALPGKKFIYAHLFITHQPFVFYPDGSFHDSLPQNFAAYHDQILFANKRILEIVKSLLENSTIEPIIIIQSDHSYLSGINRVKILNAYHLPDDGNKQLYKTITPVNSFRIIFNLYFGGKYEMLPDVSHYVYERVGDIRDVRTAPSTCVDDGK